MFFSACPVEQGPATCDHQQDWFLTDTKLRVWKEMKRMERHDKKEWDETDVGDVGGQRGERRERHEQMKRKRLHMETGRRTTTTRHNATLCAYSLKSERVVSTNSGWRRELRVCATVFVFAMTWSSSVGCR